MEAYLKCKYYENSPMMTYPNEYLVTFKCKDFSNPKAVIGNQTFPPEDEDWCIVFREDVIPGEGNSGLVKIACLRESEKEGQSIAWLRDSADRKLTGYNVPIEEIVTK